MIAFSPVCAATLPAASIIATWRTSGCGSASTRPASASGAVRPARIRSSPSGPYEGSTNDWVATAPTPASAKATIAPTPNQWDWTATPSSPVAGSRATIEYVDTGRSGDSDYLVDCEIE